MSLKWSEMSGKRVRAIIVEGFGTLFLSFFILGASLSFGTEQNIVTLFLIAIMSAIVLAILTVILLPLSGALLNPLLVLWAIFRKDLSLLLGAGVIVLQFAAALLGAFLANYFFSTKSLEISNVASLEFSQYLLALIFAFGLVFIVASIRKLDFNANAAFLLPGWLFISIIFSEGTSTANPALTVARIFSEGVLEINLMSALFITAAEIIGAFTAFLVAIYIYGYKLKKIKLT